MQIRQATSADLPEMIQLLKISMGEALIPKSEAYFLWKHEHNPFGKSRILLAIDEGAIVGLRAFMCWRWQCGGRSVAAVRAVDTATHPDHQGKGIFRKLTLQAADECREEGVGLVYNSPNLKSMPGYLKMGWVKAGQMPVDLGLGSLLPRFHSDAAAEKLHTFYSIETALGKLEKDWIFPQSPDVMHTPVDFSYLDWRYNKCPILNYGAVIENGAFGFVFRIKKIKGFMELRICEIWLQNEEAVKPALKSIHSVIGKIRPLVVSCAPSPLFLNNGNRIIRFKLPIEKGPITTVKPLAMENLSDFMNFVNWQPSIGTMELF